MRYLYSSAIVLALSLTSLTSCKKDKENPTITINTPSNHQEFTWGTELHIEATFEDDRELASYHVYIGNEAGEHAHEFELEFSGNITGDSFDFHEHYVIPNAIDMVYYLHFVVKDAEGKESTEKLMLHFMQ